MSMNCRRWLMVTLLLAVASCPLVSIHVFAQETTGGLQGTVKDPSGALVSKAQVALTGTSLIGEKNLETDNSGQYHFANLPPGVYAVTVKRSEERRVGKECRS